MAKNWWKPLVIVISALTLVAAFSWLAFKSPAIHRATTEQKSTRYVLVNEDLGGTYNKQKLLLGQNFVKLVSQSEGGRWTTASLDVANAGYNSGQYDVEVIIPQDFTKNLLSFDSAKPNKAQVTYKVREGQNAIANRNIQEQVATILTSFNARVVSLYFSSILNELAEAQQNVTGIVNGQNNQTTTMSTVVTPALGILPQSFSGTTSMAESLKSQNASWEEQQNQFSNQTVQLLTTTSEKVANNGRSLDEYMAEQAAITALNTQTGTEATTKQAKADYAAYKHAYDSLDNVMNGELAKIGAPDDSAALLAQLALANQSFNINQQERANEISSEITGLTSQQVQLDALLKEISVTYFNDSSLGSAHQKLAKSSFTTPAAQAKVDEAIQNLITPTADTANLPDTYLQRLDALAGRVDPTALAQMINKMADKNVITADQKTRYLQEIKLLKQYASDRNVDMGSNTAFAYATSNENATSTLTSSTTFTISGSTDTTLTFSSADAQTQGVSVDSLFGLATTLQFKLGLPFLVSQNGNGVVTIHPLWTTADQTVSVDIKYDWSPTTTISGVEKFIPVWTQHTQTTANSATGTTSTVSNTDTVGSTLVYAVSTGVDDANLRADLQALLAQLQPLDQASADLLTLFGPVATNDPDSDWTAYYQSVTAHPRKTLVEQADSQSVYALYHKITDTEKQALITDSVRESYQAQGIAWYNSVLQQYQTVTDVIGAPDKDNSLLKTQALLTQPGYFDEHLHALTNWYTSAMGAIQTQYEQLQENPATKVTSGPYREGVTGQDKDGNFVIYFDDTLGQPLLTNYANLATSSKDSADATASSAAKIDSLDSEFDSLSKTTNTVKQQTEDVLGDASQLTQTMTKSTSDNKTYATNFNKVLPNTHIGGQDNPAVFNFLATPIRADRELNAGTPSSLIPYLLTILVSLVSVLTAYAMQRVEKRRELRDEDKLKKLTRPWYNRDQTTLVTVVALAEAVLTGLLINGLLSRVTLALLVGLFMLVGIIALSAVFRWLPRIGLWVAILAIGLYLAMTPVLGLSIEKTSWVNWIFRLSPAQNMENAFTVAYNGGGLSLVAGIIMLAVLVVGLLLNLWVKPSETYDLTAEESY